MTTASNVITVQFGNLPDDARAPRKGAGGRGQSLRSEAEALTTRPQTWAKVATREDEKKARALAMQIENGKLAPFADAKYEAASRPNGEVWARYIGPR
jgi:hypothetical protein